MSLSPGPEEIETFEAERRARSKDREAMHRRAQKAEGRLKRVMWWIEAGLNSAEREAKRTNCWPREVPLFYLRCAAEEIDK